MWLTLSLVECCVKSAVLDSHAEYQVIGLHVQGNLIELELQLIDIKAILSVYFVPVFVLHR